VHLDGFTALTAASGLRCREAVEILIEAGADVNQKNTNGDTALMLVSMPDFFSELFLGRHIDKAIAEKLLEAADVNVNIQNNEGDTALIISAKTGKKELVEILIKADADVNIQNNEGYTALMYASKKGYEEIVEMLINAKADANIRNKKGKTARMLLLKKRDRTTEQKAIAKMLKELKRKQ
jgi:serine/threonine-protein phosphatase 6 regulatory ankyrin repeat subunit B